MVSDSIGATALKVAAVFSAISVVPPLFLDDRSSPNIHMFSFGVATSAAVLAISIVLFIVGGKHASLELRRRYSGLAIAFSGACVLLFLLIFSHGVV